MSRGRLEPPNLDDRKWQDIVDQAKALIPEYAPEWTDHSPSDLGIALIELFAWMVEGLTYRLNRVPEKNYIEFLNLIGVTRDPKTPASTLLSFTPTPNVGAKGTPVPKGSRISTPETAAGEAIIFETDEEITVLPPINLKTVLYCPQAYIDLRRGLQVKYQNATENLVGESHSVSGISIELPAENSGFVSWSGIYLGFDNPITNKLAVHLKFSKSAKQNSIYFSASCSHNNREQFQLYPNLDAGIKPALSILIGDETNSFQRSGIITLKGVENWAAENPKDWNSHTPESQNDEVDHSLYWIFLNFINGSYQGIELKLDHISVYPNVVRATNTLSINASENKLDADKKYEDLGISSGKPFQTFELEHAPLFKQPHSDAPYDHLKIFVRSKKADDSFDDEWEEWYQQEDLPAGKGNYYRLDPVMGRIYFGDFTDTTKPPKGHGSIPPKDSKILALDYRYVAGGAEGNVPPHTITVPLSKPDGTSLSEDIQSVTNPVPATGGSDEEPIEETKRRGPEVLRNRYRAVTAEDYEYLAKEATTDVGIAKCLQPRWHEEDKKDPADPSKFLWHKGEGWKYARIDRSPGKVNLIIVPKAGLEEFYPQPSDALKQEVQRYLDQRRDLTAQLDVIGPRYLPISISINVTIWKSDLEIAKKIRSKLKDKIKHFFHPLLGGVDGNGWEVGQNVYVAEFFKGLLNEKDFQTGGVGFINNVNVHASEPPYFLKDPYFSNKGDKRPFGVDISPGGSVRLTDFELVCCGHKHTIQVKDKDNNVLGKPEIDISPI